MWRSVFNRVLTSAILFQIVMIGILNLKGGHIQSYALIPLPFLTLLYKYLCSRQFDTKADMYIPRRGEEEAIMAKQQQTGRQNHLKSSFAEPSRFTKLSVPTVHEDVKHLLPKVYRGKVHDAVKTVTDRRTHQTKTNHMAVLDGGDGFGLHFNTVNSDQIANEPLDTAFDAVDDDDEPDNGSRLKLIKTNSQGASHYSERYATPTYPLEAHTNMMNPYDPLNQIHDGYGRAISDPRSHSAETQYYTPEPEKPRQWTNHYNQDEMFELANMHPAIPIHEKYQWDDSAKELVEQPVEFADESSYDEKSQTGVIYDDPQEDSDDNSILEEDQVQNIRRNSEPCLPAGVTFSDQVRRNTMPNIKVQSATTPYDRKKAQLRVSTMPLSESIPLRNPDTSTRSRTLPMHMAVPVLSNGKVDNRWSTMTETGTGSRYDRSQYGGGYFDRGS